MLEHFFSILTNFIIGIISTLGYPGVLLLMALQTMAIPIPSEVILPFAGYLAFTGRFNIFLIALFGAIGSCIGSSVAYYLGYKGGRPLVEKYGKYVLISRNDLDLSERFFLKNQAWAVFLGQHVPVVRSFLGLVGGMAKAPYKKFAAYVFTGSFIWSYILAYAGMKLGANWNSLHEKFRGFDTVIVAVIIFGVIFWAWRHWKNRVR